MRASMMSRALLAGFASTLMLGIMVVLFIGRHKDCVVNGISIGDLLVAAVRSHHVIRAAATLRVDVFPGMIRKSTAMSRPWR